MKKLLFLFVLPFLLRARMEESYHNNAPCYKADVIFVIDVSGSMKSVRPSVHIWMKDLAFRFPESNEVKIGLIHFSQNTCAKLPLTSDRGLLQVVSNDGVYCLEGGTHLLEALIDADYYFSVSQEERGIDVPKIIVLVTDGDVDGDKESIEFFENNLHDVFFVCINPFSFNNDLTRSRVLLNTLAKKSGIVFEGGLPDVYEDLFKKFEPCS